MCRLTLNNRWIDHEKYIDPNDEYTYDDQNYDDEEVEYQNPEPDLNMDQYNPKLTSKPKTIEVDAGTTIRLPCEIKHLPGNKLN